MLGSAGTTLAYIEEIDVRNARRQRIGSALFHAALVQMTTLEPVEGKDTPTIVHLDVVARNLPAIQFYKSIGMQATGVNSPLPGLKNPLMRREAMVGYIPEVLTRIEEQNPSFVIATHE